MFNCIKLNSLFDREMNVYYVTQVSKHDLFIKPMCPFLFNRIYKHEFAFFAWDKIETVINNHVCHYYNNSILDHFI